MVENFLADVFVRGARAGAVNRADLPREKHRLDELELVLDVAHLDLAGR